MNVHIVVAQVVSDRSSLSVGETNVYGSDYSCVRSGAVAPCLIYSGH